jgi:hypothetical protein
MALRPIGNQSQVEDVIKVSNDNFRDIDNNFRVNVVRQDTGNAIVQGKLPYDRGYGTLYYDSTGTPRIVIGILPDGTTGLVISKEGNNVLDLFS